MIRSSAIKRIFGCDQILVLLFDDLALDPKSTLQQVAAHLGEAAAREFLEQYSIPSRSPLTINR